MTPYDPNRHGPRRIVGPGFHAQVYDLVCKVPKGAVTTYGDIGAALGSAHVARHVGFALAAIPEGREVPWWRVVAAGGRLSQAPAAVAVQSQLLRKEGIDVRNRRIRDFDQYRHVFHADQS